MSNPFEYRPPSDEDIEVMQAVSLKLGDLYEYVQVAIPNGGERTLGIRKLQEARMWLNAALVLSPRREFDAA